MTPEDVGRSGMDALIEEWVIGNHAERDRAILKRRLLDGVCLEPLAEEFQLSVTQVKRIIRRRSEQVFRHF